MEAKLGCRYSTLLELPYFDPPTMLAIDPMHNLFLGTGKRMISIWMNAGILDERKYDEIQESVDSMVVPSDVGRIPRKIETGFSGFKADQLRHGSYFILFQHYLVCCQGAILSVGDTLF